MHHRALIAAVLLALSGCAQTPASGDLRAAPSALDSQLMTVNRQFRSNYALAADATLARTRPVIVVAFDRLHVLTESGETVVEFTPPVYDRMKSVAHIPLAIHTIVAPSLARARDPDWRARLARLREDTARLPPLLDGFGAGSAAVERQHEILRASLAFMDRLLAGESPRADALDRFAAGIAPALLANAEDAAEAQLAGLHEAVEKLRAAWSPADWARLHVVVLGPKVARAGNLQFEYFVRRLGRAAIEDRLLYAEGIFDRGRGLELVGRVVHDREAAQSFFAERMRLDRDLLADATARILDRRFGPQR